MIAEKNYLEVYTYERWNANLLPNFQTGQTFGPSSLEMKQGNTSRPKLLSEAELINLMDKSGIGTDATIHEHIKKILEREYAVKNPQNLFIPTILGCSLISAYRDMEIELSLAKPDLRSMMENKMRDVCEQRISKEVMVRQVLNMYRNAFQVANAQSFLFNQHFQRLLDGNDDDEGHGGGGPGGNVGGNGGHGGGHGGAHGRGHGGGRNNGDDSEEEEMGPGHGGNRGGGNTRGGGRGGGNMGGGNRNQSRRNEPEEDIPQCDCNQDGAIRTVGKDGPNKGRKFYGCGNNSTCNFFQVDFWVVNI
jgi:DNA topoisomerase-3